MAQQPEAVIRDLKSNKFAPVYFLHGDEPFYIDLISEIIENNALKPQDRSFNQTLMYGQDVTMATVLTNARRFPMMSERQVVIVKEAQEIPDFTKEDSIKMLENYLKAPLESSILVFNYKYKKLPTKKSLTEAIDKCSVSVESKKIYDNKLPEWITGYVTGKGHLISPKAASILSDYIGNNLSRITNEIDKLIINFQVKTEISPDLIQKYIGISKEYNVFELQSALTVKDVLKCNRIINYFESNTKNNPVIPVISSLFAHFSKMLLVHHAKDKSEKNLASLLKVHPFFVKDYLTGTRNYPIQKVLQIFGYLKTADLQSKGVEGGSISEGEILKELVFKILH